LSLKDLVRVAAGGGEISLTKELDFWLETTYQEQIKKDRDKRFENLYPSSIASCPRKAVFSRLGIPVNTRPIKAKTQRIFDNGHSFHDRMQKYYLEMGLLHGTDESGKYTEPHFVDTEHRISGYCDGIFHLGGKQYILELKSMRDDLFKKLDAPLPSHVIQGQLYVHEFDSDGVIFQYENKNTQEIKEFVLPRDASIIDATLEKADLVWECLESTSEFPCRACMSIADKNGFFCEFKGNCFDDFRDYTEYFANWRLEYGRREDSSNV